jgi:hypothetical protein
MAERKTVATAQSVEAFLDAVTDPARRADAIAATRLLAELTGEAPAMWGASIIGFGSYRYRSGGREHRMCRLGLSPRKAELVLYLLDGDPAEAPLLANLGPHRAGTGCLYLRRLSDVAPDVLAALVAARLARMGERYPD